MVIRPVQFSALVTTAGSTLMVMGTLAVPSVTPRIGLTVNQGCRSKCDGRRGTRCASGRSVFSVPHTAEAATVNGSELAVELRLMVCGAGGTEGVWKLKISAEGVQFISGLFDTFNVTGTSLLNVEVPFGRGTVLLASMIPVYTPGSRPAGFTVMVRACGEVALAVPAVGLTCSQG